MKIVSHFLRCIVAVGLIVGCSNQYLFSQDNEFIELNLHACPVPKKPDAIRLLPREQELRDGNAAIELLRMPWEQQNFMELKRKKMSDWLEMEGDNAELLKYEETFAHFKDKMRRSAYTRDADWDYPLGEKPTALIPLPDVQGMRAFVGRVMSLWIRIQISRGDLKEAEEGLLIQMACARHVCRTPVLVCNLVGVAVARIGFVQLEELIQHPKAENFYHALSMLPNSFGDIQATADIEAALIRGSIPSLNGVALLPVGDAKWKNAYEELFDNYLSGFPSTKTLRTDLGNQAQVCAEDLSKLTDFTDQQLQEMSDEETFVRWVIFYADKFGSKYISAVQLPIHEAIQALEDLEKEVDQFNKKIVRSDAEDASESTGSILFSFRSVAPYMGCHRTGRDAKLLQIVEAIRHFASQNENRLPKSLSDIKLHLPVDPFTNKRAQYELKEGVATLRWPSIPNMKEKDASMRSYKIRMADAN